MSDMGFTAHQHKKAISCRKVNRESQKKFSCIEWRLDMEALGSVGRIFIGVQVL